MGVVFTTFSILVRFSLGGFGRSRKRSGFPPPSPRLKAVGFPLQSLTHEYTHPIKVGYFRIEPFGEASRIKAA